MRITKGAIVRGVAVALLSLPSLSAGAMPQTFAGVISDSECGSDHNTMRMGDPDAACVKACIDAHGASYVLAVGARVYELSDQRQPQALAGRAVSVVGTLDAAGKTIQVESIKARQ
jgi:hypothetical protein